MGREKMTPVLKCLVEFEHFLYFLICSYKKLFFFKLVNIIQADILIWPKKEGIV